MRRNPAPEVPAAQIADYEMLRLIGRGSFGDVWIGRNVTGALRAVKVVWRDRFSQAESYEREFRGLQRFAKISLECARQLALLHVGRNDGEGFFFSVMELADDAEEGRQIRPDQYVPLTLRELGRRRGHLPVAEVIRIGVDLAGALVELHQAGLIHRDIKPANVILVGGVPKLADIGLVALEGEAHTYHVGTDGYVPPEGPGTVRADIYATGKVLYELATGLDRAKYPRLPEDLETRADRARFFELNEVIEKACLPEPGRRYGSARELLNDLALLQGGKSVLRLRTLERWRRWARRIAAAAVAVVGLGFWLYHWAEREEWNNIHEGEKRLADSFRQQGITQANEGDPIGALPRLLRAAEIHGGVAGPAEDDWQMVSLALRQSPRLELLNQYSSHINDVRFSPDSHVLAVALEGGEVDFREPATGRSRGTVNPSALLAGEGVRRQACQQVRFYPGGREVLCVGDAGDVFAWAVDRPAATVHRLGFPRAVMVAALSPDGRRIATTSPGGTNSLWDLTDLSRPVCDLPVSAAFGLAFSPDGQLVALGGRESTAKLVRIETGAIEPIILRHRNWIYDLAFSPDGRNLATASADQEVSVWNVADGELLWSLPHDAMVTGVRYDADGQHLLTVARDQAVRSWNIRSSRGQSLVLPHGETAFAADASADGQWIAAGGAAGVLRLWNQRGTAVPPESEAWTPRSLAGRWRATPSAETGIRIPPRSLAVIPGGQIAWANLYAYAGGAPGQSFLGCYQEGPSSMVLWISPDGAASRSPLPSQCRRVLNLNEEQGWLLYESESPDKQVTLCLWSERHQAVLLRRSGENCRGSKSDPHGRWLTLELVGHVELIDAATGASRGEVLPKKANDDGYFVTTSAFSPDGRLLAVGGSTGGAAPCSGLVYRLKKPGTLPEPLPIRLVHEDGIRDLAFSGDGSVLVTVGEDRLAQAWNTRDWRQQGAVMRHTGEVWLAAVSPDGTRLLTASQSRLGQTDILCLWDLTTGLPLSNRYATGGKITGIGYLPEQQSWVYELLDPSAPHERSGRVFRQPLTAGQIGRLRDAAQSIMGVQVDERGGVSPIPIGLQRESFARVWGRTAPTAVAAQSGK